ncbi:hypothetical protein ACTXPA_17790 [Glutamicibacter arilaitensis]|uniref:hypothetical protein n=1 Tax=Glutamicibacter arilaitensis TaxID=256701 RepID=UPI003FD164EA
MCRDDRRCPGQNCTAAREAHNRRRRDNRKIKKNIQVWAENEGGLGFDDVGKNAIDELKVWARDHGAPHDVLVASTFVPRVVESFPVPAPQASAPLLAAVGPNIRAGNEKNDRKNAPNAGGDAVVRNQRNPGGDLGAENRGRAVGGGGGRRRGGAVGGKVANADKKREPLVLCGIDVSDKDRQYVEPLKDQIQALVDLQNDTGTWQESALRRGGKTIRTMGGGINTTKRISIGNDAEHGYFKSFVGLDHSTAKAFGQHKALQPIHEVAAWQFAKELGPEYQQLVSPCIIREVDGQLGSVSYGQSGRVAGATGVSIKDLPKDQVNNLAFYDALIGQQDRHTGNYLVDNRGVVAIDHGFTFANNDDYVNFSRLQEHRKKNDPELTQKEFQLLVKITKSGDCLGMKKIIGEQRSRSLLQRAEIMLKTGKIL